MENKIYNACSVFLITRSEFFKKLLTGDFQESRLQQFRLSSVPNKYFNDIYDYMMTGKLHLSRKEPHDIIEIIKHASYFMVNTMVKKVVRKYISDTTCLDFYNLSQELSSKFIANEALNHMMLRGKDLFEIPQIYNYLVNNFSEDVKDSLFLDLKKKTEK